MTSLYLGGVSAFVLGVIVVVVWLLYARSLVLCVLCLCVSGGGERSSGVLSSWYVVLSDFYRRVEKLLSVDIGTVVHIVRELEAKPQGRFYNIVEATVCVDDRFEGLAYTWLSSVDEAYLVVEVRDLKLGDDAIVRAYHNGTSIDVEFLHKQEACNPVLLQTFTTKIMPQLAVEIADVIKRKLFAGYVKIKCLQLMQKLGLPEEWLPLIVYS